MQQNNTKAEQMMRLLIHLTPYASPTSGAELNSDSLDEYREMIESFFFDPKNEYYLTNHAAYDLMGALDINEIFRYNKRITPDSFGDISRAKEHPLKLLSQALDLIFDAILETVPSSRVVFFSQFLNKSYGEIAMGLEDEPGDIYRLIAGRSHDYDGYVMSHIMMHMLMKSGEDELLRHDQYGPNAVAMLKQYIPESKLLKHGGPKMRRYLCENDLSL